MAMTLAEKWLYIVKKVAEEQNFEVSGATAVEIYIDHWHGAGYQLKINSSEYLQVHQWECKADGSEGRYGRAIYSLRSYSDVAEFCGVLLAGARVRARR